MYVCVFRCSVCGWFSPLLREVFLRALRFSRRRPLGFVCHTLISPPQKNEWERNKSHNGAIVALGEKLMRDEQTPKDVYGGASFPLSAKTNISKFQFDQESGRWRTTLWMCYLQIYCYYCYYYYYVYNKYTHLNSIEYCMCLNSCWSWVAHTVQSTFFQRIIGPCSYMYLSFSLPIDTIYKNLDAVLTGPRVDLSCWNLTVNV